METIFLIALGVVCLTAIILRTLQVEFLVRRKWLYENAITNQWARLCKAPKDRYVMVCGPNFGQSDLGSGVHMAWARYSKEEDCFVTVDGRRMVYATVYNKLVTEPPADLVGDR